MKRYVLDASVSLKWFLPDEPDTDNALNLLQEALDEECRFLQPPHWITEMLSVLARLRPREVKDALDQLLVLACCETVQTPMVYAHGIELAIALDHHLFDTLYHAVAIGSNATLLTADRRYFNKARKFGNIALLGNVG